MDPTQSLIGQPVLTYQQRLQQLQQQEAVANGQMAPPQMQPGMAQGQSAQPGQPPQAGMPPMQPPGMAQAQFSGYPGGSGAGMPMSPQQRAQLAALLQARGQ